jgi:hypothetical protein
MSYDTWNTRLFDYFFNENYIDSPVICYVDESLIDEKIGKDIGGSRGFIKSIIAPNNEPQHFVKRLGELVHKFTKSEKQQNEAPDYFGVLCLTIAAWTVDANLHGSNYYERLNGLLSPSYEELGVDPQSYIVGKGINQNLDRQFRLLLKKSFKLLEDYTGTTLDMRKGFFEFRRVGSDYVDIPKAQALLKAKDREGLEYYFSKYGIQPGIDISPDEVRKLIMPTALNPKYLTYSTLQHWKSNSDNQNVICEIVSSLLKHWDGAYKELDSSSNASGHASTRRPIAYLWPVLSITPWKSYELKARIEFANQDFPPSPINLKIIRDNSIGRQYGAWSCPFSVDVNLFENILIASSRINFDSDYKADVCHFPKKVYLFEKSILLGGYIPAKEISIDNPYFIFLRDNETKEFVEVNHSKLMELSLSNKIEGWSLYEAANGLLSIEGLNDIRLRSSSKVFELLGGAKIGHGARHKFSEIVPPSIQLLSKIPDGSKVICKHGIDLYEINELEDSKFEIDSRLKKEGIFEVFVSDVNGGIISNFNPIFFELTKCKMPEFLNIEKSRQIHEDLNGIDFLFDKSDFSISFEGAEILPKMDGTYLQPSDGNSIVIEASHRLLDLEVFCGETKLEKLDTCNKNIFLVPSLDDGTYAFNVQWHGTHIYCETIKLTTKPIINIEFIGAFRGNDTGTMWLTEGSTEVKLNVRIKHFSGPSVYIDIDRKSAKSLKTGEYAIPIEGAKSVQVNARWCGLSLFDKKYEIKPKPDILIELDENTGSKWRGSQIFDPRFPPNFNVLVDEKDAFLLKGLNFLLGDTRLVHESIEDGLIKLSLPQQHTVQGISIPLFVELCDRELALGSAPCISLKEKPSCKIIVEGRELEPGVFRYALPPKITISPPRTDVILLMNDYVVKPDENGSYAFPAALLSKDEKEKEVTMQIRWWDEIIHERVIKFVRKYQYYIALFGAGSITDREISVFAEGKYPRQAKLVKREPSKPYEIKFGQIGKEKVVLSETSRYLYSLGDYDAPPGSMHAVEIWQGDLKLHSIRFIIAGSWWLKLGPSEGRIANINTEVDWLACWFIEKRGKHLGRLYNAGNCPKDCSACPCDTTKKYSESYSPSKSEIRLWRKYINKHYEIMDVFEKGSWDLFVGGIKK